MFCLKGRPQFDHVGVVAILTDDRSQARWEGLVKCTAPIESCLHKNLAEHLNSAIVLKTIQSLEQAKTWLHGTYLYVRLQTKPEHYGLFGAEDLDSSDLLDSLLKKQLEVLQSDGILRILSGSFPQLEATSAGILISRYSMSIDSFRKFAQMEQGCNLRGMLTLLSQAAEFDSVRIRGAEKAVMNTHRSEKKNSSDFLAVVL